MVNNSVILYSRDGCHLCEEAEQLLQRYGITPEIIDIDGDPELQARFTNCVPVVVWEGRERFRGRVNEVLLKRLLRHASMDTRHTTVFQDRR